MPTPFTLDGRELLAQDGETVIQAAHRHGVEIPHFCYHSHLSVAGNCRMCLVKVNNLPKLMPACNLAVAPKMVIETQGPEVQRARQNVLQFILLNHPVDCGVCDKAGECSLQDNQHAYGLGQSRSQDVKLHKRKLQPLGPRISLDNERCILCSRCVRFTREISGSHALAIVDRGSHSYVEQIGSDALANDPYSDNVVGLCPTGALLSTDFLYRSRVWFLEPVRSVCTGCARGCSVEVWRRNKWRQPKAPGSAPADTLYRVTALDNPEINGPWICNKGFDLHHWMRRERALQAQVAGQAVPTAQALAAARSLFVAARSPAVLVSAHGANEELDALVHALGARFKAYTRQDLQPAPGEVVQDERLIRADKNPNSHGVTQRFGVNPFDASTNPGHDLIVVWGEWADRAALGSARVIHLATFGPTLTPAADVVLPLSTTLERAGSFDNFEGRPNRFEVVCDPPPGVLHAADVFRELAA